MTWLLLAGMVLILGLQVLGIYLVHEWHAWTKLTFVPWFVSISNAVNPERK